MTSPHLTKPNAIVLIHPAKHRRPEHLGHSPRAIVLATMDYQPDEAEVLSRVVESLEAAITQLAWDLPIQFAFCDTDYRVRRLGIRNIGLQKMFASGTKREGQWTTIAYCGNGRAVLRALSELTCIHWEPPEARLAAQLEDLAGIIDSFEIVISNAKTVKG